MKRPFVLQVAALLIVTVACTDADGDRGVTTPTPQPPAIVPTPITDVQRTESFAAIAAHEAQLRARGLSKEARFRALAEWMRERPEFEVVELDGVDALWARFRDGRIYVNTENFNPNDITGVEATGLRASATTVPRANSSALSAFPFLNAGVPTSILTGAVSTVQAVELPRSTQVRLLHPFGKDHGAQVPISAMAVAFEARGYTVLAEPEGEASVEMLRQVSNDAFFYINTHGGRAKSASGDSLYALWTSTKRTEETDELPEYKVDLAHDRLVYYEALVYATQAGDTLKEVRYAITHKFIREYMSFAPHSVVFINVCWSGRPNETNTDLLVGAFQEKGANLFLGWTDIVSAAAAFAAPVYFVERLLGINTFRPSDPPDRSFAWPAVLAAMKREGLDREPNNQLVAYHPALQSTLLVGAMVPSIQWLHVNDQGNGMLLAGIFGSDPRLKGGHATVTVGGLPVEIIQWGASGDTLLVELPPGRVGDVVVTVDGRQSNPRRVIEWSGTIVYRWKGDGTLEASLRIPIKSRLDPDLTREIPGGPLVPQGGPAQFHVLPQLLRSNFMPAAGLLATYSASGSHTEDPFCPATTTWSGNKTFAVFSPLHGQVGDWFNYFGWVDARHRRVGVAPQITWGGIGVEGPELDISYTDCNGHTTTSKRWLDMRKSGTISRFLPSGEEWGHLALTLDEQINIMGGERFSVDPNPPTLRVGWDQILARPAFDPRQPK